MKRKLYLAYGSNMNIDQMCRRCKDAVPIGKTELPNYKLVFRGSPFSAVATIEAGSGFSVPVAIWAISEADERALDRYEGFPHLYIKKMFNIFFADDKINAMAYIMTGGRPFGRPSETYLNTICTGYDDFGFVSESKLLKATYMINSSNCAK